jgi:hypothetical protein
MKVRIENPLFRNSYDFLIADEVSEDEIAIGLPVEFKFQRIPVFSAVDSPTFSFMSHKGREFIQAFVNEAFRLGFSPEDQGKKIEIIKSELVAVKYHLEDMRKLVFEKRIK